MAKKKYIERLEFEGYRKNEKGKGSYESKKKKDSDQLGKKHGED